MNEKRKEKRQHNSGVGIALGLVFGSSIGLTFGLIFGEAIFGDADTGFVIGQVLGSSIGLVFGVAIESTRGRPNDDNKSSNSVKTPINGCIQPRTGDIDMETQTKEKRSAWGKFLAFMRCVYRHDQRVWKSIFGGRC